MDQFMKLPPGQKAAVLAALLAVLGIGMYFLMVDPDVTRADSGRAKLQRIESEIKALEQIATPEAQDAIRQRRDDLVELDKENRKMLPAAEELPDFVDSVQADAQSVGLAVTLFHREEEVVQDLYNSIPIRIVVEGTVLQFIQFMRIYAGPERRVINIAELAVDQVPVDMAAVRIQLLASKPIEAQKEKSGLTARTAAEQMVENIEMAELIRNRAKVRASFTAYAFIWTGKPMEVNPDGAPAVRKLKKKRT